MQLFRRNTGPGPKMHSRFKNLVLLSCFLILSLFFFARSERGNTFGKQTYHSLDSLIQQNNINSDSVRSHTAKIPFPGEEEAELERKKRPKPADLQIEIEEESTPNPKTKPVPTTPKIEERLRLVDDYGYQANETLEPQQQFREEYDHISNYGKLGQVFGATLNDLNHVAETVTKYRRELKRSTTETPYTNSTAKVYNPYPLYNSFAWKTKYAGTYVECEYPKHNVTESSGDAGEVLVFPGQLEDFPLPSLGSYNVLGINQDLCYERQTRLGAYGYSEETGNGNAADWDVDWGNLQSQCLQRNINRFSMAPKGFSHYINNLDTPDDNGDGKSKKKSRSAILLRSYTGKNYTENDKQTIRSLVVELSLKTGGEYEVFLLVQVKDNTIPIWSDDSAYIRTVEDNVPEEFWGMAVLWNDAMNRAWYPQISPPIAPEETSGVHAAQWLSVQIFAQHKPQFDYYWNWELDFRYTGHTYELLEKLAAFGAKQPRRGLWERNERYYNPTLHGNYDTDFRKQVEEAAGDQTVWSWPYDIPDVNPVGPHPPTYNASEDNYEWGVGEEADLITLGPIFNPKNTAWVSGGDVYGYKLEQDLPRRATIITHARCSKRLLDAMHDANINGQIVSSEMTPATVALLHGLKAVYAPHPVYFDREWKPESLEKWFNGGPEGQSGSHGESPFGWGREERFKGSTWYYRADTPERLYNNWMGWGDTGFGGKAWEQIYGRACLPPILLHPVKDVIEPPPGFETHSQLPY